MAETARGAPTLYSVVVPAFNEEAVIADTVRALARALDREQVEYEILVVNDGSSDRTEARLLELEAEFPRLRHVNNPAPHGYGYAVRCGLANFRGDAVAVVMADGADSPDDLVRYFRKIQEGADCAFGARFDTAGQVRGYPLVKRLFNRLGNWLIALLVDRRYTDFTNGFKCYRRHVIEGMQPLVCGQFNLTVEMSLKAVLGGASYAVVNNTWVERSAGTSKFKLFEVGGLYLMTVVYCLIGSRLQRSGARR